MASELRSTAGETLEFEVGPVERDEAPIEILLSSSGTVTTAEAHGYATGDHVRIDGHVWNPINGVWVITVTGGSTFTLSGAVTGYTGGQTGTVTRIVPVDLTLANTTMIFSAKRRLQHTDLEAFLIKGSEAPLAGITLNQPSSPRKNLATVTIPAADTAVILDSEDLYYDVELTEPDGRVTRLDHGIWKVGAAVYRA